MHVLLWKEFSRYVALGGKPTLSFFCISRICLLVYILMLVVMVALSPQHSQENIHIVDVYCLCGVMCFFPLGYYLL